jgi:transposase
MSFVPVPRPPESGSALSILFVRVKPNTAIAKDCRSLRVLPAELGCASRRNAGRANSPRLPSDEKRELAELRKKARGLDVENEILNVPPRISLGIICT